METEALEGGFCTYKRRRKWGLGDGPTPTVAT